MESEKYSEEKINFFWHNGKKILIKPVGMPVNFIADYKLRFYIAWYEPLRVYGIGASIEEAVEDIRNSISTLYQHYYLGNRDDMVGNSHYIIAWFDEHLKGGKNDK